MPEANAPNAHLLYAFNFENAFVGFNSITLIQDSPGARHEETRDRRVAFVFRQIETEVLICVADR